MKSLVASAVLIVGVLLAGLVIRDLNVMSPETLILCSSGEGGVHIPRRLCEYYLVNHRDLHQDAAELAGGAGLGFILQSANEQKKYRIAELFIAHGLDVNGVDSTRGHAPLFTAILLNDPVMVRFLLDHGASPGLHSASSAMSPLEFLYRLQENEPDVDRFAVEALLVGANY